MTLNLLYLSKFLGSRGLQTCAPPQCSGSSSAELLLEKVQERDREAGVVAHVATNHFLQDAKESATVQASDSSNRLQEFAAGPFVEDLSDEHRDACRLLLGDRQRRCLGVLTSRRHPVRGADQRATGAKLNHSSPVLSDCCPPCADAPELHFTAHCERSTEIPVQFVDAVLRMRRRHHKPLPPIASKITPGHRLPPGFCRNIAVRLPMICCWCGRKDSARTTCGMGRGARAWAVPCGAVGGGADFGPTLSFCKGFCRSEEHTSELQSLRHL